MGEVLTTMMGRDDVASGASDTPQCAARARGVITNASLDQAPCRLDGTEVMRVGRQWFQCGAALFNEETDLRSAVSLEIVQQHDIAAPQPGREPAPHPVDERGAVHRAPLRAEGHPAAAADRSDQREIVAPVHRPSLHIFLTALHPHTRAAHGEIRAGFIDKHQPVGILAPHPCQERFALRGDIGPVDLARPRPFFLSTKPARRIARRKLVGVVRCARGTRRLYCQQNSFTVASGTSRTTACSTVRAIGHRQPPPRGFGATVPVARHRATHRSSVRMSTSNSVANWEYDPSPLSYALTARSRNATSYGFGMPAVKYISCGNSSAIWD